MAHEKRPEKPTQKDIDQLIRERFPREDPVNVVTRSLLGHIASEGVAVVRPDDYREIKETARGIVKQETSQN